MNAPLDADGLTRGDAETRLRRSPGWLAGQPEDVQDAVLRRCTLTTVEKNAVIFRLGDPPGGLYGIAAGIVMFYRAAVPVPTRAIHASHVGAWFGEPSLIRGTPRMVTAVAHERSVLLHLSPDAFADLVAERPVRWRSFAILAADGAAGLTRLMDDMRPTQPESRVAATVLRLVEGDPPGRAVETALNDVTQGDLAAMARLSRNTTNRVLNGFAERGLLDLGYRRLRVLDADGLRREVEP